MKALIFAAGLGTRLKPLTDTTPKALVRVAGKPLLWHVASKLIANGYNDLVINVHHFADDIISYINENNGFGADVKVSDERDMLRETGGGIAFARPLLGEEDFLIHNVDILSNLDLVAFRAAVRKDAVSTVLVSERITQRYLLFNEQMRLVGWTNTATGEVKSPYAGLKVESCRKLAFAGIHYASGKIFEAFEKEGLADRFPIMDFYIGCCDRYPIYGYIQKDLELIDVGKLETLSKAEEFLNRQ